MAGKAISEIHRLSVEDIKFLSSVSVKNDPFVLGEKIFFHKSLSREFLVIGAKKIFCNSKTKELFQKFKLLKIEKNYHEIDFFDVLSASEASVFHDGFNDKLAISLKTFFTIAPFLLENVTSRQDLCKKTLNLFVSLEEINEDKILPIRIYHANNYHNEHHLCSKVDEKLILNQGELILHVRN
ncbi:hypothetical protein K8Q94_01500 [Candidatus Nomurabacteria bacterium]|nr:hypothetical protein [Candidatus Nomurabacteria bacterium]